MKGYFTLFITGEIQVQITASLHRMAVSKDKRGKFSWVWRVVSHSILLRMVAGTAIQKISWKLLKKLEGELP